MSAAAERGATRWIVLLVGVAVVLLVVALRRPADAPEGPPGGGHATATAPTKLAGPAPKLAEVVDPKERVALPLPVASKPQWDDAGPRILYAEAEGLKVEVFDSQGPPVQALRLYEMAVQNATNRGLKVVAGDRSQGTTDRAEVLMKVQAGDGAEGHIRYILRGTRYVQVRAMGPGSGAVVSGLRLP